MHCHDQTTTSVKENKFRTKQTKEMPVSKMSDKYVFFLYSTRNNKICRKVYFDFLLSVQSIHKRFHLWFLKVWQKKTNNLLICSHSIKNYWHTLYTYNMVAHSFYCPNRVLSNLDIAGYYLIWKKECLYLQINNVWHSRSLCGNKYLLSLINIWINKSIYIPIFLTIFMKFLCWCPVYTHINISESMLSGIAGLRRKSWCVGLACSHWCRLLMD